jgi:hypothetical protein
MRCAVVNSQNIVVNMIMADPEKDTAPDGCVLYEVSEDVLIDIDMNWDDRTIVVPQELPPEELI